MHIDPEQRQNIARRLRSLSQDPRQPYDWTEFRRRARERASASARRAADGKRFAALAAALLLVVVGVAAWIRFSRPAAPTYARSDVTPLTTEPSDTAAARADVAERWLASLPDEPIVIRVGTRATIAGLEDRIAQLDDILSVARAEGTQPAKLSALEAQRARLVSSLVQVRYAETLVSASR